MRLIETIDGNGHSIKEFMPEERFLRTRYPNDRKAGKAAFRRNTITMYDAYVQDPVTKNWGIAPQYQMYVNENTLNLIKNKADEIGRRLDGSLSDLDRSAIHAGVWSKLLTIHHNFIVTGLIDRFKKRQYSYATGMYEEGTLRSMGWFLNSVVHEGNILKMKSWLEVWDSMDDMEKAGVTRTIYDFLNIMMISLMTTLVIVPAAEATKKRGDDDWWIQSVAYLAVRAEFEFRSMYNPWEFYSLMKNPSAAVNFAENVSSIMKLFYPDNYLNAKSHPFKKIARGPYKGLPTMLRPLIKATPFKNIFEATQPETKRLFLQSQLMTQ
jgi:hypothetical protein